MQRVRYAFARGQLWFWIGLMILISVPLMSVTSVAQDCRIVALYDNSGPGGCEEVGCDCEDNDEACVAECSATCYEKYRQTLDECNADDVLLPLDILPPVIFHSNPSCTGYGLVEKKFGLCAVRSDDNAPYIIYFQNGRWTGRFERLPAGIFSSDPSCAPEGATGALCALRGTDSALYVTHFDGNNTWSAFQKINNPQLDEDGDGDNDEIAVISNPSCANYGSNSLLCAVRGQDNALYVTHLVDSENSLWSKYERLEGGIFSSDPSCTREGATGALCAVVGTDSALYVSHFDGNSTWSAFENFYPDNLFISAPSCTSDSNGVILCAAVSVENKLLIHDEAQRVSLEGLLATSAPSCTSTGSTGGGVPEDGASLCAVRGQDNMLYVTFKPHFVADPSWSEFVQLEGDLDGILVNSNPSCANAGSSVSFCAVVVTHPQNLLKSALYNSRLGSYPESSASE